MRMLFFFENKASVGYAASVLLHGAVLIFGSFLFMRPIEYGVEQGSGGIEVSLTAAAESLTVEESLPVTEALPSAEEMPAEAIEEILEPKLLEKSTIKKDDKFLGDGSSPVPGQDSTTFYSEGGAIVQAKPNYLKNPPPGYPESARKMGQEGVVLLGVRVSDKGWPLDVEIKKSSGYSALDLAAKKAVRRWKFDPARLAGLRVESEVEIPIRFRLDN